MKDEFLSIIMECAASIVNEKNSENSLLRDECGETLYGQVLTQLTNAIANLLSSIWIKEYSEARNNHIINDSTVESRFSHFRKLILITIVVQFFVLYIIQVQSVAFSRYPYPIGSLAQDTVYLHLVMQIK